MLLLAVIQQGGVINDIKEIPGLDALHWVLAYLGLSVHLFLKLAETPGPLFYGITKRDILTLIASAAAIPAILIMCTDTSLHELLPINYVTAFLAGFQTQSILRSIGTITGKYSKPTS
jgi:hypothetical protein